MFNDKAILITGGTGSFGKKFIRTILKDHAPRRVVVFSRDEFATLSRYGRTVDFSEQIEDFEDTAALLANVELLISVDTAVLNLAGAMHLPAWGMLPFAPEWRWQGAEQRSIWYPELTLYRQAKPGDWQSALDAGRRTLWSHLHAIHA